MQTIKGLVALALVTVAVFTAVLIFNNRTEPKYVNEIIQQTSAETDLNVKQPAPKKSAPVAGQKAPNSKL